MRRRARAELDLHTTAMDDMLLNNVRKRIRSARPAR
jgi:hypothetical protein